MSDDNTLDVVEEGVVEGSTRAAWEGSDVKQGDIDWLIRSRRIPDGVACRIPGTEIQPDPQKGEYVVFLVHFERGFGLPSSAFFRNFLDKFRLQPHQLPANAILIISSFTAFTEGYLGLCPSINLWSKFFSFRKQVVPNPDDPEAPKEMTQCGAATVIPRRGSDFFRIKGLESCRKWLRSWFYVKNTTGVDLINLPEFKIGPPTDEHNWRYSPGNKIAEVNAVQGLVPRLKEAGLTGEDLVTTFISRRVSPLQRRVHKICHMSGHLDPTRTSTFELTKAAIRLHVKAIATVRMS